MENWKKIRKITVIHTKNKILLKVLYTKTLNAMPHDRIPLLCGFFDLKKGGEK